MRVIKTILLFIFVLVVLAAPVAIALLLGRSIWEGLLGSAGILSFALIVIFIRALWMRHREKRFIDTILEPSEPSRDDESRHLSGELSKRWKQVVRELKKSRLKHQGNPLYVLPWFMLIGESGSGKTTAIRNSRLSASFTSHPKVSGLSGTKNCDWWFFDSAIVIDTAGRYAIQPDDVSDRDEWRLFLAQLAKYRKKEPLNGLVVTLPADRILTSDEESLKEEGRKIRGRIEELMHALGARFPVYLLVTKCDLIRGMTAFCDSLPPAVHDQALGYLDMKPDESTDGFLDRAFTSLGKRIRYFRLHISNKPEMDPVLPEILLFPEEFDELKKGLDPFIESAFQGNRYQEPPLLRGMYFTSGRQSGQPVSHFLKTLKLAPGTSDKKPSEKSYFLHDFFKAILPRDRNLFVSTRRARHDRMKTKVLGFSAWVTAVAVLCGLLSFSFVRTLSTVRQVQKEYARPPHMTGHLVEDLNTLEHLRTTIVGIEKRNRSRWLPRFGLGQCDGIEHDLKALYCASFSHDFIAPYDESFDRAALDFTQKTPGNRMGEALSLYARRIHQMKAVGDGAGPSELAEKIQPDFRCLVFRGGGPVLPEALALLETQYNHYLAWEDRGVLFSVQKDMQDRIKHLLTEKGLTLEWLTGWCNEKGKPVTLADFWRGSGHLKGEIAIPFAYTVKGYGLIRGMLNDLSRALEEPIVLEKAEKDFLAAYRNAYIDYWYRFVSMFPKGAFTLSGKEENRVAMTAMAGRESPYFSLLDRMETELSQWLDDPKEALAWLRMVIELTEIRSYEATDKKDGDTGALGTVTKKGLRMLGRAGKVAAAVSASTPEKLMVSAEAFKIYRDSLGTMGRACGSLASSLKLASDVFSEDPVNGQSCMATARRAAEDLKLSMANYTSSEKNVIRLLDGPIDYLWGRIARQAACQLQTIWNETVLSEVEGVYDKKLLAEMLLGPDGYVNTFSNGPGRPFIGKNRKRGYYAKKREGESIPFTGSFLTFLTRGAYSSKSAQNLYKVKLDGLPTDANPDAAMIPHLTRLDLECAQGAQTLENHNYPVSRTFEWSPVECGDVELKIMIGNLVLKKDYTGFRPFARFIRDFSTGKHTFFRSDFPDQSSDLKRMGIKFITVKYKISGGGPVITLLNMEAGKPPEVIVSCSD